LVPEEERLPTVDISEVQEQDNCNWAGREVSLLGPVLATRSGLVNLYAYDDYLILFVYSNGFIIFRAC
jgi:hypothetical protein